MQRGRGGHGEVPLQRVRITQNVGPWSGDARNGLTRAAFPAKSRTSIQGQAIRYPLTLGASTRAATPLGRLDLRPGLGAESQPVPQGIQVNGRRHVPQIVLDRPLPARHPAVQ